LSHAKIFLFGLSVGLLTLQACKVDPKAVDSCGDGIIDPGEQCDGSELGGATCAVLGYHVDGPLTCRMDCTFDTTSCGPICGDGAVDSAHGEECDGTDLNGTSCTSLGAVGGVLRCDEACRFDLSDCTAMCGNGRVEEGEACDDGGTSAGDGCSSACALEEGFDCTTTNPTVCTPNCGDGLIVGAETCDGALLGGRTCQSEGFYGGELVCGADCRLDTAGCAERCGDGVLQAAHEACDGAALGGQTCATRGFYQGTLRCASDCTFDTGDCRSFCGDGVIDTAYGELCDGLALAGNTCTGLGYHGGTLACLADCSGLDTAPCAAVGRCGDGAVQASYGEVCDGADLDSATCETLGFHGTGLACDAGCALDLTACEVNGRCGDGEIQASFGEACDGANLGGQTCESLGWHGTGLACDAACELATTACEANGRCGDGAIQASYGEQCDGLNLDGLDCGSLGYHGVGLFCDGECLHDWSVCVANGRCGDGAIQASFGEQCDGVNLDGQTCRSRDFFTGALACDTGCAFGPCQNVVRLGVGGSHACAILDDGTLKCWGRNGEGQCGDGTLTHRSTPVQVAGLAGVVRVDGAANHTCALLADGTGRCWGYNYVGTTLGNAVNYDTVSVPNPVTVVGLTGGAELAVAGFATCVLKTDWTITCWGMNTYGQLGDGTNANRQRPQTTVSGLTGAVQIDAGLNFFCARDGAGTIWCWGRNDHGQLGDGTTTDRNVPVQVAGVTGALHVSCGENFACALLADGTVACWGSNAGGQLGDGTTTGRLAPVAVSGLAGVVEVAAGNAHTCARLAGGSTVCWGANAHGQLGNGTTTPSLTPVTVTGLTGGAGLLTHFNFNCVRLDGATVRCWGENGYGSCGDGTTVNRSLPVRVLP